MLWCLNDCQAKVGIIVRSLALFGSGRIGLDYPVAFLKIDRQREIFISSSFEDEISMTSSDLLLGRGLW
jgi:hypothetical protein